MRFSDKEFDLLKKRDPDMFKKLIEEYSNEIYNKNEVSIWKAGKQEKRNRNESQFFSYILASLLKPVFKIVPKVKINLTMK